MSSQSEGGQTSHAENLVAGAIAGLIAETLLHPFDTINTRMKACWLAGRRRESPGPAFVPGNCADGRRGSFVVGAAPPP